MSLFGLGRQKPHHYREMARIAWENRDQLPFAWRILKEGVCDGCALGTSGLSDWTLDGVHLCMVRLELMRLNTAPALDPKPLTDIASLASDLHWMIREGHVIEFNDGSLDLPRAKPPKKETGEGAPEPPPATAAATTDGSENLTLPPETAGATTETASTETAAIATVVPSENVDLVRTEGASET